MAFPGTYNFNYYAGDTFEFFIYPKNSSGGVFDNLGDYSPRFHIAEARGSASGFLTSSSSAELLVSIENDEYVSCTIQAAGGQQLTGQSYVYDVEIEHDTNGKVHTLVTGVISVTQDVTRE